MSCSSASDVLANGVSSIGRANGTISAPPQQAPVKLPIVSNMPVGCASGGAIVTLNRDSGTPVRLESSATASTSVSMLERPPTFDSNQPAAVSPVNNQLVTPAAIDQLKPALALDSQLKPGSAVDNQLTPPSAVPSVQQQEQKQSDAHIIAVKQVPVMSGTTASVFDNLPQDGTAVSAGTESGKCLGADVVPFQDKLVSADATSESCISQDGAASETNMSDPEKQPVPDASAMQDSTTCSARSVTADASSSKSAKADVDSLDSVKSDIAPSESAGADIVPSESARADVTSESAKADVVTSESAKADVVTSESAKVDVVTSESAKVDVVTSESAKVDVVTSESAKVDVVTSESAKADVTSESAKADVVTSESAKADVVPSESAKADIATSESASVGSAQAESVVSQRQPEPADDILVQSAGASAEKGGCAGNKRQLNMDKTGELASKKPKLPVAEKTPRQTQRRKQALKVSPSTDGAIEAATTQTDANTPSGGEMSRPRRARAPTQPFQSTPLFSAAAASPASSSSAVVPEVKHTPGDGKLIVFFKNEFMAVLNEEKSFYVCRAMQNVTKSSRKIKVRWMTCSGRKYIPDFYDVIDFESILTSLTLTKLPGGNKFEISVEELKRTKQILERALNADCTDADVSISDQNHPDGLDISLYNDESQLDQLSQGHSSESPSDAVSPLDDSSSLKKSHRPKSARPAAARVDSPRKGSSASCGPTRQRRSAGPAVSTATASSSPSKSRVTPGAPSSRSPSKKSGKARTVASEKAAKQKVLAQAFARGKRASTGRGKKSPAGAASSDTGRKQAPVTPVAGTRSSPRRRSGH